MQNTIKIAALICAGALMLPHAANAMSDSVFDWPSGLDGRKLEKSSQISGTQKAFGLKAIVPVKSKKEDKKKR